VPVQRYRSVEDMPTAWRDRDDPGNLSAVATMMAFYRQLQSGRPAPRPGVRRFRTLREANADRNDPLRSEAPGLLVDLAG